MANTRKRISELTALTSASLDTTLVGVDGGTTYKIELDTLADAVTSRVNILDRDRLSSLESVTSSFETKGRALISSSAQISAFGFISSSTETDISALNSFTSSQNTLNSAFTNGINARLQTSSFNDFSASIHNEIVAATNEQDLSGYVTEIVYGVLSGSVDSRLDNVETFTQSIDGRVDSLESWSSSLSDTFATDLEVSIVSSSVAATIGIVSQQTGLVTTSSFNDYTASQSTGSLVNRLNSIENITSSYELKGSGILSGSISYTDLTNIPDGIVSQSVDIANFTFTTDTITNGAITLHATNSDIVFNADGAVYIGSSNAGNQIITDSYLAGVIGDTEMINNGTGNTISNNLTNIINSIPTIPDGIISGSEQITAFGFISSSQTIDTGSLATTGSNTFNGNQTINGSLTINFSTGIPSGVSNWNGQGGWNQGFYSDLATTGGTGTGLTVDVAAGGSGYIDINQITINTPGSGYTNGDIITIDNENNLPGSFTLVVGASSLEFNSSSVEFNDLILNGSGSFQSDLTVYGNLKVWGTQSIINSTNVELSDNILYLSPSGSGDFDLGIVGHYNDGTYSHTGIFSDASDGHAWKVFKGLTTETTGAYIDTNGAGYTLADFKANNIYGGIHATNNVVSGSSQLTSSFDTRYTLSGSVQPLPSNLVSSSAQITAFGFISSSTTINTGSFVTTSSFNVFTASALTTGSNTFSGSQIISGALYVTGLTSISTSFSLPTGSSLLILSGSTIYVDSSGSITGSLSGSIFGIGDVVAFSSSVNSRINSAGGVAGTISGSSQITAFGFVSGSYETTGRSIVSGSSQLTSSYDTRYTLSGSVSAVPSGTISGSSQLTSSFDSRYVLESETGSLQTSIVSLNVFTASQSTASLVTSITNINSFTSSLNIWSSSVATTGSNSFNGNQTITGSLNVSSMAVVSSSFTTNSSSLYLTSGSNFYLQNNGIVEITGSLIVSGSTIFKAGGGFEGGEIALAYAPSGSTLTGSAVSVDIYQNRLRIFEGGGTARGVYVDLSKAPNGVAGELLWKASGLVNAGVDVTLGNLKARLASSGNYSLQVSTVSGTYSVYGSSVYSYNGIGGVTLSSPLSITTTPTYLSAGYNFLVAGSTDTWIITDTSAGISWRISLMIGPSFTNNMITIERLV